MQDKLFYINNEWLTYEQSHSLGYTLTPSKLITLYTSDNSQVQVKKDDNNQYYDSSNLTWVDDFNSINLFNYINTTHCYIGESSKEYKGYSNTATSNSINCILYDDQIVTLYDLYNSKGITTYQCTNIITYNDTPIVWYDSSIDKYFDDRYGKHTWSDSFNDVAVTMYDSSLNEQSTIYENTTDSVFYIDNGFVGYLNFYSRNNYGIIREHVYTFLDSVSYDTYYDFVSDKYCIPNITNAWLGMQEITDLGYIFIDGVSDLWLNQSNLQLSYINNNVS